jgi:hypothetical protein
VSKNWLKKIDNNLIRHKQREKKWNDIKQRSREAKGETNLTSYYLLYCIRVVMWAHRQYIDWSFLELQPEEQVLSALSAYGICVFEVRLCKLETQLLDCPTFSSPILMVSVGPKKSKGGILVYWEWANLIEFGSVYLILSTFVCHLSILIEGNVKNDPNLINEIFKTEFNAWDRAKIKSIKGLNEIKWTNYLVILDVLPLPPHFSYLAFW